MKIKKPAEEIEVCDHCQRGGYLETCIVCGRQHCLSCQGIIAGCWVGPKVCKECDDREDVRRVVARYAEQITPIIRKRTAALKRLPSNTGAHRMAPAAGASTVPPLVGNSSAEEKGNDR